MTQPPQPNPPAGPTNPYASTPPPQSTWDQPAYTFHPLTEHPQATTVLVLGVLGLFLGVTGPFAWVIGHRARAETAVGRYAPSTSLTVGWVLGIITTFYLLLVVTLVFVGVAGLLLVRA